MEKGYKGNKILQKFTSEITGGEAVLPVATAPVKQIDLKREAIMYRYYYYIRICKLTYSDTLDKMKADFFLSTYQITQIVTCNAEVCKRIFNEGCDIKTLTNKYPGYSWQTRQEVVNKLFKQKINN